MAQQQPRGVQYKATESNYFEKRDLRRNGSVLSLWGMAIGLVISGNFFGWNFGLTSGGFGGMLVAVLVVLVLYSTLTLCIAEMSPALPHTGGAYSFGRTAMGPWGGFITGIAETIAFVGAGATVVVGIGGYSSSIAQAILGIDLPQPVWWLLWFAIFLGINIAGAGVAYKVAIFMAILSTIVLVIFWIGAIPYFDLDNALNVPVADGGNSWFPGGWQGVFFALPFAAWLFFGIESLPLSAEEVHAPEKAIPKALLLGMTTLAIMAFLTVTFVAGTSPGSAVVGVSDEPLNEGFRTIFGTMAAPLLGLFAMIGLVSSFHGVIFTYGRNIYSLSRAGYYPTVLSLTHGTRKTPYVGLIAGTAVAYVMALLLHYFGTGIVGAALLSMSVFGAVISYIMQTISFIRLRIIMPNIKRPYVSPLGIPGALVSIVLAGAMGISLFWNEENRMGVLATAIVYAVAVVYFALMGRKRLVLSPVEQFANENRTDRKKPATSQQEPAIYNETEKQGPAQE